MNQVLKQILLGAVRQVATAVPGGGLAEQGVEAIITHKDSDSTALGIENTAEGAIQVIETIDGKDIADEQMFRAGVALTEQGLALIRRSLVTKDDTPAAA